MLEHGSSPWQHWNNDMSYDNDAVTEGNRAAWNAVADQHRGQRWQRIIAQLTGNEEAPFNIPAQAVIDLVDYADKDIVQLACNNGRELLWLKRHGARRCVGVDISDEFIAQARELSALSKLEAEFERSNICDLGNHFDGQFDLVLTTIGVFNWQPDLAAFMSVVARLLKPGGKWLVEEMHPLLWMFEREQGSKFVYSYFDDAVFAMAEPLDYYGGGEYQAPERYEFQHTVGEVLQTTIDCGLRLRHFQEFAVDNSGDFRHFENQSAQLPLSYNLIAEKPK